MKAIRSIALWVCINLPQRKDRLAAFTERAADWPFTVSVQDATPGEQDGPRAGNLHSFARMARLGLRAGAVRMGILEDDARLRPGALPYLTTLPDELDSILFDWDIYLLGVGLREPQRIEPVTSRSAMVSRCGGTHALILNRSGMEKIAALNITTRADAARVLAERQMMPDVLLTSLGRTMVHHPILFDQVPGHSDIMNSHMDPTIPLDKFITTRLTPAFKGVRT